MNPTNIEWVRNPDGFKGHTWNPVTGCNGGCKYCYARPRARMSQKSPNPKIAHKYRNGFKPTFHPEILDQPAKRKKSTRIFVVSMGDLFGDWVSDEWIKHVFEACGAAPQHTYYFLTKNPDRYTHFIGTSLWDYAIKKNMWFGATIVEAADGLTALTAPGFNTFVSAEPLNGPMQLDLYYELHPELPCPKWIIVGGQTNPTKLPKKEWVLDIKKQCEKLGVPLFMKNNLAGLGIELVQQFPEHHD